MTKFRKSAFAVTAACALAFTGGMVAMKAVPATADESTGNRRYYGAALAKNSAYAIATAFYDELVQMATDPDGSGAEKSAFEKGASHAVTSSVILDEAKDTEKGYASGSTLLTKQFGAALDSFRFDYADLFYVNFDLLTFTVTQSTATGGTEEGGGEEKDPEGEEGGGENQGGEENGGEDTTTDENGGGTQPSTPAVQSDEPVYAVTIGSGRAATYFTDGFTAENLTARLGLLKTNYDAIMSSANTDLSVTNGNYTGVSTMKKAEAVNRAICTNVRYKIDESDKTKDLLVGTVYGAAVNKYADSEGYARLFKKMMEDMGEECVLVSGYYVVGNATSSQVWNYVKSGEDWFAVDVYGNCVNKKEIPLEDDKKEYRYNQYLWLTDELFGLEHYEDGIVSAARYTMPYPKLGVTDFNIETGKLKIQGGKYLDKDCYVVTYADADKTLYIRLREGDLWGEWISFEDFDAEFGYKKPEVKPDPDDGKEDDKTDDKTENGGETGTDPAGENEGDEQNPVTPAEGEEGEGGEGGGEGEEPVVPTPDPEKPDPVDPEPADFKIAIDAASGKAYLYLKAGDFQIAAFNDEADEHKLVEYSGTVMNPEGAADYVAPVGIVKAADDIRAKVQKVGEEITIEITYSSQIGEIIEGAGAQVDFTVSSPFGHEVNLAGAKASSVISAENWASASRKLTFTFKPSPLIKYNALRYEFFPTNLASDAGAKPLSYVVTFAYDNIVASKVFAGNNAQFVDTNFTQPMLVNTDYDLFAPNVRNQLALVTTKPAADTLAQITAAVDNDVAGKTTVYREGALKTKETFEVNLMAGNEAAKIPTGSFVELALPYPAGYGPETQNLLYKVYHLKLDAEGKYAIAEILDPVKTRQGLVVSVNSFSPFTVAVFDVAKIIPSDIIGYKRILTETSGIGGTVTAEKGNKLVNTIVNNNDTIAYTIVADKGYQLDYVMLNNIVISDMQGNSSLQKVSDANESLGAVYKFTVNYGLLVGEQSRHVLENVLRIEFTANPAAEGTTNLEKSFVKAFAEKKKLNDNKYEKGENEEIVTVFPSGGFGTPETIPEVEPPKVEDFGTASTKMQYIIVLGTLAAAAVIGLIALIFGVIIRPKIIREREEEAARIAANRERRANRNRLQAMNTPLLRNPNDPNNPPPPPMGK